MIVRSSAPGRLLRLARILGISLAVAVTISLAHLFLFPSLLNEHVILHPVLLRNGFVPYQHIPDQKPPLLPLFLSWTLPLFKGDAVANARTVHALLIGAMVILCMAWSYRSSGLWALAATGFFLLAWSNSFGLWAIMYYDFVLGLIYLIVFLLLAGQIHKPTVWGMGAVGLVSGLAILTKQYAILLLMPTLGMWVGWLATGSVPFRRSVPLLLVYLLGLCLPIALFAWSYYRQAGSFQDLIHWTVSFNLGAYPGEATSLPTPTQVIGILPAFLMLVPFASSIVFPGERMRPGRGIRLLLLVFFLLGALCIYPRYGGRHWAAAFPFMAILSGIACADLMAEWPKRKIPCNHQSLVAAIMLFWVAISALGYIPALKSPKPPRWAEYSELVELADALRHRIPAQGGLVLLPTDEGNSNLYYLLGQLPPHYWLMNYPWWMNQVTISRWLATIEEEKPHTLLLFPGGATLMSSYPEIGQYVQNNYRLADAVEWRNGQVQITVHSDVEP